MYSSEHRRANSKKGPGVTWEENKRLSEGRHSLLSDWRAWGNSYWIIKFLGRILCEPWKTGRKTLELKHKKDDQCFILLAMSKHLTDWCHIQTTSPQSCQINVSWPLRVNQLSSFPVDPKLPSFDLNECAGNYKAAIHRETFWSTMFAHQRAAPALLH